MASAEELIQEAQFAFHNIGPGSTDETRNRARAKKFAMKVLRRYPVSPEAHQARAILAQLKVERSLLASTAPAAKSRTTARRTVTTPVPVEGGDPAAHEDLKTFAYQEGDAKWADLWRQFGALPQLQKNIVWSVLIFLVFFFAFTPFLLIFILLLLTKRDALRDILHKALISMHPDAQKQRHRRKDRGN